MGSFGMPGNEFSARHVSIMHRCIRPKRERTFGALVGIFVALFLGLVVEVEVFRLVGHGGGTIALTVLVLIKNRMDEGLFLCLRNSPFISMISCI
jgi:hypothetical protein